jgi:hypothetical protein
MEYVSNEECFMSLNDPMLNIQNRLTNGILSSFTYMYVFNYQCPNNFSTCYVSSVIFYI